MNIGIDIDGVLTNDDDYVMDVTSKYIFENKLEGFEDPYRYEYRKFNWTKEILDDYRKQYFWNYIYIITSRHNTTKDTEEGEKTRKITKEWLKENDILYDEIYFSPDKTKEIDSLKIDIMIEDSPETIPTFVNHTHVFCYDCKYNRDMKLDNMTRVFSWYDIYMKIQKFKNI